MSTTTASHSNHILPLKVYLTIGTVLLILTAITVTVSFFDLGAANLVVAMVIAAIKASLVALYFMHLKYDSKLYLVIFLMSIFFLACFIIITMFDTLRRDDIYEIKSGPITKNAAMYERPATDTAANLVDSVSVASPEPSEGGH